MRTHVAMILDGSGSMDSCRQETIDGFNGQVEAIGSMARADHEVLVSLSVFRSQQLAEGWIQQFAGRGAASAPRGASYVAYLNEPLDRLGLLAPHQYEPQGGTPLYDAVGEMLERLAEAPPQDGDDAFLVMIFSDGQENESTRVSGPQLASMIQNLQATGYWTFTFMGADQQALEDAIRMGIPAGNVAAYAASPAGTAASWRRASLGSAAYMMARESSVSAMVATDRFFGPDPDAPDTAPAAKKRRRKP